MVSLEAIYAKIRSGKAGREEVIRVLYTDVQLRNGIKKVMRFGNPSDEDFNEIFDFTLVQFLKQVMSKETFSIRTNLNSYLFGIAKFLWIKKLNKRKTNHESLPDKYDIKDEDDTIDLILIQDEKKRLLHDVLGRLGKKCKEVLMYWAAGYKMAEIASMLDYTSEVVVRKKKFTCMKQINSFLEANPAIKVSLKG